MQDKKLTFSSYMLIGSALFGLFFGAGNLIFPVQIGQEAGANMLPATLGFLITAVGLPFLGILAIGLTNSNGLYGLASKINHHYAVMLTVLLYLTIGPLFSLPRTGSVAFEIGFANYLPEQMINIALFIFTLLFFGIAYYFSMKPSKLMDLVGKILNPIFLTVLGIVIIAALFLPMGSVGTAVVQEKYLENAFFKGILSGYDTMDGLASLAFGIVIVQALKDMGVKKPQNIAKSITKSGVIVLVLMVVIYISLIYVGVTSTGIMDVATNGGVVLAKVTNHYFGRFGAVILAIIVIFACLKTAIGLITACSETFVELFPRFTYKQFVLLNTIMAIIVANFGLTSIIELAKPILMFIYPLSISLILLGLLEPLFNKERIVYLTTTIFVLYASVADGLTTLGAIVKHDWIMQCGTKLQSILPFSTIGMGWIIPALLGFTIGYILTKTVYNKKT